MSTETLSRLRTARHYFREQQKWIEQCGGTLAGYIARYGSAKDTNHLGDGGEAIYKADIAELVKLGAEILRLERL